MSGDNNVASDRRVGSTIFGVSSGILITLILISPILFTLFAYPDTFILSWNEGRGGFLFAMAFIAAELVGLRHTLTKERLAVAAVMAALTISYFIALPYGLNDYIRNGKDVYNVSLVDSWMWMWDFIIMGMFVTSSLILFFGKKWYKIASAGAIYLGGSALILALDAFFPFDSLGPLQIIVPIYLQIDQAILIAQSPQEIAEAVLPQLAQLVPCARTDVERRPRPGIRQPEHKEQPSQQQPSRTQHRTS